KKARPDLRNKVKTLVLGVLYGRGAAGVAEAFGCPLAHAEAELGRFFDRFPGARDGAARAVESSLRRGYGLAAAGLVRPVEPGGARSRPPRRHRPHPGGFLPCGGRGGLTTPRPGPFARRAPGGGGRPATPVPPTSQSGARRARARRFTKGRGKGPACEWSPANG